ncbi:MAG: sulfotransferase [Saprospirales bacterium]|nr:MAG: sulfotransferase [Saprospirales bacterium]
MEVKGVSFIVGGQRCGTTFLMNLLSQHGSIEFPQTQFPEPKFFIKYPGKGSCEFKNELFGEIQKQDKVLIEKSTSYVEYREALVRINEVFPNSNIFFIVRDPVQRAISNYFFSVRNGLEKRCIREAFLEEKNVRNNYEVSVNPFDYIGRSRFSKQLKTLEDVFCKDRLHILSFRKLTSDTNEYLNHIIEDKLGLESGYFHLEVEKNESAKVKSIDKEVLDILEEKLLTEVKFLEENDLL